MLRPVMGLLYLYLLICLISGSENSLSSSVLVPHFSLTVTISGCVDEVFGVSVVMFYTTPPKVFSVTAVQVNMPVKSKLFLTELTSTMKMEAECFPKCFYPLASRHGVTTQVTSVYNSDEYGA